MHRTFPLALALFLLPALATADEPALSIGVRTLVRTGDYTMGGVGGQLRIRPLERLGLDFYAQGMLGSRSAILRRDVEIGGTLQYDVFRTRHFALHPLVGTCVMLATATDQNHDDGTLSQVWWGVAAGAGVAWTVGDHVTLQAQVQAMFYVGHAFDTQSWFLSASDSLSVTPMGQAVIAVNYGR